MLTPFFILICMVKFLLVVRTKTGREVDLKG